MYPRLSKPLISRSFFLFGARGTGKTRFLNSIFSPSQCLWIDLLKEGELLAFSKNPNELTERLKALPKAPEWIVIDEVQRAPQLLNTVHSLIESQGIKFALTGSSARKLKRGGANLLAGRALLNNLYPLTFIELGKDFSLSSTLQWGTLPAIMNENSSAIREEILKAYVEVYLREEIREEQIIRRLDPFVRFLEVAAQSSGKIINLSRIAREATTDPKSINRYFQILEDTLLGSFLEPYHQSIRKRQRNQAKFYFFDIGVKRSLEGTAHLPVAPQTYEWGVNFEHFIVLEALRLNEYTRRGFKFSYLRTTSQVEIDLIAERKGEKTKVIEIKSGTEISLVEIHKLLSLSKDIPNSESIVICNAKEAKRIEGVRVLPWREGLLELFPVES